MNKQRLTGFAALVGAGVLLAGCGTPGGNALTYQNNLDALRRAAPQSPSTFPAALSQEYLQLSDYETKWGDWIDADWFARKGLQSARGQAPGPDAPNTRELPADKRGELDAAYQRLNGAFTAGGRERLPAVAARAQSRYDCWLEQQEENWQIDDVANCRGQFLAAMAELEARPAAAPAAAPAAMRDFRVYFEWDRADLTPEARQILQQVAQAAQAGQSSRLELVGKADRSGATPYNQRLSERRSAAVMQALTQGGVASNRISSRAVGETQPPVPTPDGVREPRNRVVEITIN
jgi:OmpA-OmpF porin, OOP family